MLRKLLRDIRIPENIRPRKNRERFYVDNLVLSGYAKYIKPNGIAVYNVLSKYANSKDQCCWPAYELIMKESGIGNRGTVVKCIKRLEKCRLIGVFRKNKESNIYSLLRVIPPDSRDILDNTSITSASSKYQFCSSTSGNSDTENQRIKSDNKIEDLNILETKEGLSGFDRIRGDVEKILRIPKTSNFKKL